MYHQDSNYIHAAALTDYSAATYLAAYNQGLEIYRAARPDLSFIPTYEIADNAMTQTYIKTLEKKGIEVQLVPPNNHRANNAERCVQTFKNHLISVLATCDPSFPESAVKHLLPLILLTLNLLRKSHISNLSAYEEMHGHFDSNRYKIHPPGTRMITLDAPESRLSFAPHGVEGFYVGPAMSHYRCHNIYCPATNSIRRSDSVAWIPFERIIPKYPTLPPGLFESYANPSNPTSHLPPAPIIESEGVDEEELQNITPYVDPIIETEGVQPNSEGAETCDEPFIEMPATPTAIADTPFISSPMPHLPEFQANYLHYMQAIKGPEINQWRKSMHHEVVRLIDTTKTARYRPDLTIHNIPEGSRFADANPIIVKKANKVDPTVTDYRTRLTWHERKRKAHGTSLPTPPRETTSSTIDTLAVKILLNSIISDPNAIFSTLDLNDFYLHTALGDGKKGYLRLKHNWLPAETRQLIGTTHLPDDADIILEVDNVVYGMDDAGRKAQIDLVNHLALHGYHMHRHTPGLFYHETRTSIHFSTWVDDFAIKSDPATDDLEHLINVIAMKYPYTFHLHATKYLGIDIDLHRDPTNHANDKITLAMKGYVKGGLKTLGFQRTYSPKSPMTYSAPIYGPSTQYEIIDSSPPATATEQSALRQSVGIFRFYADAIDSTIKPCLSRLATQQSAPTMQTMDDLNRFHNYIDQYPDAQLVFRPSDMQLHVHSDASYLNEPKSRSRYGGIFTMGPISFTGPLNPYNINGPILVNSGIIPTVVGAASEAEYAGLYLNAQDAEVARQILADLGHPQRPTRITYDNTTAGSIAKRTAKIKRSKAIAMRYHWIQDRVEQKHFDLLWDKGANNCADFQTKAHPIHHFQAMRPCYISFPAPDAPT